MKIYLIIGWTVVVFLVGMFVEKGLMKDDFIKVQKEREKSEERYQSASIQIASKWQQQITERQENERKKDKEITRLRNQITQHLRANAIGCDYQRYNSLLGRVYSQSYHCGLRESANRQSHDNASDFTDVLRESGRKYWEIRDQLAACTEQLKSLPCVEIVR